jgi:hypothetical protein
VNVKDVDKGYKAFLKELRIIEKEPFVKVGYTKDEQHDDGTSVVTIASPHEFGTATIPERSTLRAAYDENKRNIGTAIDNGYSDIIKQKQTALGLLSKLGVWFGGLVQQKITDIKDPALVSRDGNPLVDTGFMRASIRHEVVKDGSKAKK